ncbi:MAG: halocarboxylic acid dehydrogenase DehI family protein [Candidatus Korobacteraceae bacterium]
MRWKRGNRLKLVTEGEASAPTRQIFDEIRNSFGVPVVPKLYQAYAAYPEFLQLHWQAFRPAIENRQFFLLGARLAAESYTRAHNYFEVRNLGSRDLLSEESGALPLGQVLDYYQYLDPLLLVIAAAQMQAFEGPIGQPQDLPQRANHPSFPVPPRLLSDAEATPVARRIWDERRRMLELAFISDEHRALACWPGFYEGYWLALKELLRLPLYSDSQFRMGESAWSLTRELPAKVDIGIPLLLDADLDDEQVSSVVKINEAFLQALSGLLLDVTFARIAYEGGTRRESHRESPLPVEKPPQKTGSPTRAA